MDNQHILRMAAFSDFFAQTLVPIKEGPFNVKILILASSFSGLCQRVLRELVVAGHSVEQHYGMNEVVLRKQLLHFQPQLVVCPFLTHRIPSDIWQSYTCLIVHPGIEGDRGPSSLDWAIIERSHHWGVTLLQAAEDMDAGDIWGTEQFPLRLAGKTSSYKREVSAAAVALIKQAIEQVQQSDFTPRPLDYAKPDVKGRLRDLMCQADRRIHWAQDSTSTILAKLQAADTSPGVLDTIAGYPVHLFGAINEPRLSGEPGELLAVRYGSVCRATTDGAIWIRQLKCAQHATLPGIKLPASTVLRELLTESEFQRLLHNSTSETANDIRVEINDEIAYVHFDFYNGAASTEQCLRLKQKLISLKQQATIKTLVLMGGEDFFSNGIHLNCIEAAANPADESWSNINAIDDVVKEIIDCPNQVTVAALRNNAGAGGAILALACDKVVIRDGVVLNPHYDKMGLYGSEYWTYLLPKRVGDSQTHLLVSRCEPLLAQEALAIGFADVLFSENWHQYHSQLVEFVRDITQTDSFLQLRYQKRQIRIFDESVKPLAQYRQEELKHMSATFYDRDSSYHQERKLFVYKGKLPVERRQVVVA